MQSGRQLGLFNEAEAEQVSRESRRRRRPWQRHTKKPKRTIDELTEGLPEVKVLLVFPEAEQVCDTRRTPLKKIGETFVCWEIVITQRQIRVLELLNQLNFCHTSTRVKHNKTVKEQNGIRSFWCVAEQPVPSSNRKGPDGDLHENIGDLHFSMVYKGV